MFTLFLHSLTTQYIGRCTHASGEVPERKGAREQLGVRCLAQWHLGRAQEANRLLSRYQSTFLITILVRLGQESATRYLLLLQSQKAEAEPECIVGLQQQVRMDKEASSRRLYLEDNSWVGGWVESSESRGGCEGVLPSSSSPPC